MNIVVCLKQVPNTSDIKIDPRTNNLVREGVESILNPNDENALEQALLLRQENPPCTVIAVSMGPPQAGDILTQALDMGADRAILLADRALSGSDTLATGYALAELIKRLEADLVLCGSEAIDGCTGQVGPIIAENLGIPQVTYVNRIALSGRRLEVSRGLREADERLSLSLPALLCLHKNINTPRQPVPSGKKPEICGASELGLDASRIGLTGSPTRVVKILVSDRRAVSFVSVDSSLPARERIRAIVEGGVEAKNIVLTRGTPHELAETIFKDEIFYRSIS
jgi:electron transfer flavoprotein beta subunit